MRTPGYKTSEFWFTLVSFIVSGLFLFGIITEPDTKDQLIDVFTHVTESRFAFRWTRIFYYINIWVKEDKKK